MHGAKMRRAAVAVTEPSVFRACVMHVGSLTRYGTERQANMAGYTPCEGSGTYAVNLHRYDSQRDGLGMTQAKTFGECSACGRTVMERGLAVRIKVARHKAKEAE